MAFRASPFLMSRSSGFSRIRVSIASPDLTSRCEHPCPPQVLAAVGFLLTQEHIFIPTHNRVSVDRGGLGGVEVVYPRAHGVVTCSPGEVAQGGGAAAAPAAPAAVAAVAAVVLCSSLASGQRQEGHQPESRSKTLMHRQPPSWVAPWATRLVWRSGVVTAALAAQHPGAGRVFGNSRARNAPRPSHYSRRFARGLSRSSYKLSTARENRQDR